MDKNKYEQNLEVLRDKAAELEKLVSDLYDAAPLDTEEEEMLEDALDHQLRVKIISIRLLNVHHERTE